MGRSALVIVDVQKDFCPGGALAVPDGDAILPYINSEIPKFEIVVATQDWHPDDHGSFVTSHPNRKVYEQIHLAGLPQMLWPKHCVQGTNGAEFHPGLHTERIQAIFPKGVHVDVDSYSGFFDNARRFPTRLNEYLQDANVDTVAIVGLATDYCVKYTALDSVSLGYKTMLLLPGCRGVDVVPGDVNAAIKSMREAGVHIYNPSLVQDNIAMQG